jgi:hypothetical protein
VADDGGQVRDPVLQGIARPRIPELVPDAAHDRGQIRRLFLGQGVLCLEGADGVPVGQERQFGLVGVGGEELDVQVAQLLDLRLRDALGHEALLHGADLGRGNILQQRVKFLPQAVEGFAPVQAHDDALEGLDPLLARHAPSQLLPPAAVDQGDGVVGFPEYLHRDAGKKVVRVEPAQGRSLGNRGKGGHGLAQEGVFQLGELRRLLDQIIEQKRVCVEQVADFRFRREFHEASGVEVPPVRCRGDNRSDGRVRHGA